MIEEVWKDVVGYEGYYQVSNLGKVKSVDRYVATVGNPSGKRLIKGKILSQAKRTIRHEPGYCFVGLSKNNITTTFAVHRLVAQAFIPNPGNLPCVNHKDENKFNNNVNNLEWCTVAYNNTYGTARERGGKKKSMPVVKLGLDGYLIRRYKSLVTAAKEEGVTKGNLANICVNRNGKKTLNGFVFMYEKDYLENGFVGYDNPRLKKVEQYDLDGNYIRTFDSVKLAYASTGYTASNGAANISAVCRGRQKSAYGYKWRYADDVA